ncbi:MAG: hypothetical protein EA379_07370 [Phycisphaerales bacterium]|nr:MAG: hypothetical protein EA379_07370 [Phycisphaerales bacterium]
MWSWGGRSPASRHESGEILFARGASGRMLHAVVVRSPLSGERRETLSPHTPRPRSPSMFIARFVYAVALASFVGAAALAQSSVPAVFVANNGNLEGSVSSFVVNPDGTVTLKERYITGTRPSTSVFEPGCNAYAASLSPNGRHLVTSHAAGSSSPVQQLSMFRVHDDASIEFLAAFSTPTSPLGIAWITNDLLAVTRTGGSSNGVYVYRYNPFAPGGPTLTNIDIKIVGSFTSYLAAHPSGKYLYASNSLGGSSLFVFEVNPNGTLTQIQEFVTPALPLGPGISADGRLLYAGGGISAGGKAVIGATIDSAGMLAALPDAPWTSPGASPKQVVLTPDNAFAAVAHGTDSSVRIFSVDEMTGDLTYTGGTVSIGIQGSLGEIGIMDNLLFACDRDTIGDGERGLRAYEIDAAGLLTPTGPIVDTGGIAPNGIAVWKPCPGDANGDGVVDFADLSAVLANFGESGSDVPGDVTADGVVDFADLSVVLANFGSEC